jgi:hypothetical protein
LVWVRQAGIHGHGRAFANELGFQLQLGSWFSEQFAATLLKRLEASVPRNAVLHHGQLDFLAGKGNLVLLGPPGTGKAHLSIASNGFRV